MSRFNFEVDNELRDRVRQWPEGVRSSVLRTLLVWAADIYDKHGMAGLGAILDNHFHIETDKIKKAS